jgi:NADH-ubiquinone oxidoreductase chain 4
VDSGWYLCVALIFFGISSLVGWHFLYLQFIGFTLFLLHDFFGSSLFYICMILAFLFRMPMFVVHFRLPRAHVEAPVSVSVILAGVLLKLGGYGCFVFFLFCVS